MSTDRSTEPSEDLDAIEGRLAGTLRPVHAPNDFVQNLRGHMHMPENSAMLLHLRDWERLVMVFGGVFSGAVVIVTVARILYHLLGRRNG